MTRFIPFPRWRCTCGHIARSDADLDAHYDDAHPSLEDPRHPEHEAFMRWRRAHVGR